MAARKKPMANAAKKARTLAKAKSPVLKGRTVDELMRELSSKKVRARLKGREQ